MTNDVQLVCQSSIEISCQSCSSPESSAITPGCLPQQSDECQCICEDHCYCPKELRCSIQPGVSDISLHVCITFKAFAARLDKQACTCHRAANLSAPREVGCVVYSVHLDKADQGENSKRCADKLQCNASVSVTCKNGCARQGARILLFSSSAQVVTLDQAVAITKLKSCIARKLFRQETVSKSLCATTQSTQKARTVLSAHKVQKVAREITNHPREELVPCTAVDFAIAIAMVNTQEEQRAAVGTACCCVSEKHFPTPSCASWR